MVKRVRGDVIDSRASGSGETAGNRGGEQMYLAALNPACMELLLRFCNAAIISTSVESILNSRQYCRIFILIPIKAVGQLTDGRSCK